MPRKNPLNARSSGPHLVMIADLSGQIVHVIGNAGLLGYTPKQLYLKNFLKDLLTEDSQYELYDEFQNKQIMPSWINSRSCVCAFRANPKHHTSDKDPAKLCRVKLCRIFVKFGKDFSLEKLPEIRSYNNSANSEKQAMISECQQAILISIEKSEVKSESTPEEDSFNVGQKVQEIEAKNQESLYEVFVEEEHQIFQTPPQRTKRPEKTTGKAYNQFYQGEDDDSAEKEGI